MPGQRSTTTLHLNWFRPWPGMSLPRVEQLSLIAIVA